MNCEIDFLPSLVLEHSFNPTYKLYVMLSIAIGDFFQVGGYYTTMLV